MVCIKLLIYIFIRSFLGGSRNTRKKNEIMQNGKIVFGLLYVGPSVPELLPFHSYTGFDLTRCRVGACGAIHLCQDIEKLKLGEEPDSSFEQ